MASIEEVISSFTPLTRSANEWHGACLQCDGALSVIGDRWRCSSCSAHDAGDDAAAFLMLADGCDRAEAEAALTNGRIWTPALIVPPRQPPKWGLHRVAGDPRVVLIVDDRAAAKAVEERLPGYLTVLWPGGGSRWDGLEPLRGRVVLLWPTIEGLESMERLELVLTDQSGLGCTGKFVVPSDAAPWDAETDTIIAWAKERVRPLVSRQSSAVSHQQPNPAQQVADGVSALQSAEAAKAANAAPEAPLPPALASPADAGFGIESDRYRPNGLSPVQGVTDGIGPLEVDLSDAEPPPTIESDWPANAAKSPRKRRSGHLRAVDSGNLALAPDEDAEPVPAPMSEDAIADAFAAAQCEDWRYVREWDRWYRYDGDGWRVDKTELIDRLAVLQCRQALNWPEAASLTPDGRKRIGQRRTAGQVRDMARHDRRIAATAEQWDTDPLLLGCPGGAIDLRTGKLIEAERDAYITMRTAIAPEKGEPAQWLAHLDKALQGDTDTIAFLRRYLGYMLTGDVGEHCLVFFYGTGRNGKGTIVETVIKLLGDYGYAAPMNLLTEAKSERHPTELAALRGRRAVSASEPPEGARWDDGRIRFLTGGDTINARGMRQDPFTFEPTHKLLLMGNHMPSLRSVDPAITARFKLIEFSYFFPPEERDRHFADKLRSEWPQILHWMLQGCMEWQDAGLGLPEKIEIDTENYLQGEDEFAEWIIECCDVNPAWTVKASEAYRNFRAWAEQRGSYVPSQKAFGSKLKDRGYSSQRTALARMYKGFSLKLAPAPG